MGWKEVAAGLGTESTVRALKAAEGQVSKRKYRRLIATAVAELLAIHPDIGPRKARRRARRVTGARPSKKLMRTKDNLSWKEGAEGVAAAAATVGVAKVADFVGHKLKKKFGGTSDLESSSGVGPQDSTEDSPDPGEPHSADLESTR